MKFSILILFTVLFSAAIFAQAPDTLWTKTFGESDRDAGFSVDTTSDGGYIITGINKGYGGGLGGNQRGDVWLIKTDANGDTLWTKTFGDSFKDEGSSVQQTTDGGYIIAGLYNSNGIIPGPIGDLWLIKTDANGDTMWTRTYGGSDFDEGKSVQQTSDGGYIITGTTGSFGAGSRDVWLIKTDANGDTLWTRTYGGTDQDGGSSIQQTSDGGYIITGYTYSFGAGITDVWLIKTDTNGDTLWTRTYGGSDFDEGTSVQQTSDGGYIITGSIRSFGAGSDDVWLIKTNANGDTLWTKTFGGTGGDGGYSIQQTSDGGYIIAGSTQGDVWLIKVAPVITSVDDYLQKNISGYQLQQSYPNPFNPTTTIEFVLPEAADVKLTIYNTLGQEVTTLVSENLALGEYHLQWDGKDSSGNPLTSGVYFYRLTAGSFTQTRKMILMQ